LQLLELIQQRPGQKLDDDELRDLVRMLNFHVNRYRSDYDEHVAELRSRSARLEGLARWLPDRMPTWWADLDRAQQVWVGYNAEPPAESRVVTELSRFHDEASKPRRAFWTSTLTPDLTPWLEWIRPGGEAHRPGPYHLWRITAAASARVFEIHSPAAWSGLARAYPSSEVGYTFGDAKHRPKTTERLDPDWSKVARDWDGVHLSMGGWLTAEDAPYESRGVTTEPRGWSMESTAWLRWSFDSVEALGVTE
jgi:hypothetical protein